MHQIMFDLDGTLIQSYDLDGECLALAVSSVLGVSINTDWSSYAQVTDSGILNEVLGSLGLDHLEHENITQNVKRTFLQLLHQRPDNAFIPVRGAQQLIEQLKSKGCVLSIATGGWRDSALLKLQRAGLNIDGIVLASADDHHSRAEIMKLAASRAGYVNHKLISYFGDGIWDKNAAEALGYNFILVGERFKHDKTCPHFCDFNFNLLNL